MNKHLLGSKDKCARIDLDGESEVQGGASEHPAASSTQPFGSASSNQPSGSSSSTQPSGSAASSQLSGSSGPSSSTHCSGSASSSQPSGSAGPAPMVVDHRDSPASPTDEPPSKKRSEEDGSDCDELLMEVICEDADWHEHVKSYREAEIEEEPSKMARGNWADMTEEEQMSREEIYDDLTGRPLEYEQVLKARLDDFTASKKMCVWEVVPVSQFVERTGRKPIRGRWVDVNKGDDEDRTHRSRYVAQEIRQVHGGSHREGLFAAMPPIEALRLVVSRAVKANYKGDRRPTSMQMCWIRIFT